MGISVYNLKKWTRMLTGKSIYHVDQGLGKAFEPEALKGYFNDMTQKVLQGDANLENGIPFLEHTDGSHVQMPTMIFQYGLGAFDLWLLSERKNADYLQKAVDCAEWAMAHQQEDGSWNNFFYVYPEAPYSAMPQGEAASLLLRVYVETKEPRYFDAARKAIDFMLLPSAQGGVALYENGDIILLEYTHLPVVMNGWIFALFGLYDFCLASQEEKYHQALQGTLLTLEKHLPAFDNGYWSKYELGSKIASPFYHHLHVAQMKALHMITGKPVFEQYCSRFAKYEKSIINKARAFLKKAMQKVLE